MAVSSCTVAIIVTGNIRFNEGNRTSLKLDLLKLRQDRLVKVGEWTTQRRLNVLNHEAFHDFGSTNITLRVTTIEVNLLFPNPSRRLPISCRRCPSMKAFIRSQPIRSD